MDQKYIVAEISKNWPTNPADPEILSKKFEKVINVNLERNYVLKDWKLSRFVTDSDGGINETIIAVFERP